MTRPILAGYCPRTADRGPVDFAIAVSRATGAPVLVVAIHSGGAIADVPIGGELADQPEEAARAVLEPLRAELGSTVEVRARVALTPAAGLTAAAKEVDARLIVLGSSTRSAIGRVLPGSTAERVVHGAPCPVAVVPPRPRDVQRRDRDRRCGVRADPRRPGRAAYRRPARRGGRGVAPGDHGPGSAHGGTHVSRDARGRPS